MLAHAHLMLPLLSLPGSHCKQDDRGFWWRARSRWQTWHVSALVSQQHWRPRIVRHAEEVSSRSIGTLQNCTDPLLGHRYHEHTFGPTAISSLAGESARAFRKLLAG